MFNLSSLPLSYRFIVCFFIGGFRPNPFDIAFKKVSGLSAKINIDNISEGGENLCRNPIPKAVEYSNLTLERGMVIGSLLNVEFNVAMSLFKFFPSNVLVALQNEHRIPIAGWLFYKAFPATWTVSDLEAESNNVMIDTMELAYSRFQSLRV